MSESLKQIIAHDSERNSGNGVYLKTYLKLYRTVQFLNRSRLKKLGFFLDFFRNNIYAHRSVVIPAGTSIGGGVRIPHLIGIVISEKSVIGKNCTIFQNVTIGASESTNGRAGAPSIGDNVYIGANSVIIGSIVIGEGAKIGAGAVVTKDVPSYSMVTGVNQCRISM